MKLNNLFTGAFLIMFSLLFTDCNKDDVSPYKSYSGELGRAGYCSVVNQDGDLYIVGTRDSEILVMKTSMNGELIWEKTYNLFGQSFTCQGFTIEETFDNGFIISAFDVDEILYSSLLKINESGDSTWSAIFQDSHHVALKAVVEASDHSIFMVYEEETDIYQDLHQVRISKISQYGEFLSSKVHPEIFTSEVWFNAWQADQDGNIILSTSQYDQAGSIWTVSSGLEIISQVSFNYGKEVAYFSETSGTFICADEIYEHSTLLPLSKESPGNAPLWAQEFPMPCVGWAYHTWAGPATGGYLVLGTLWDEKKSQYYMHNSYCIAIDAAGNQTWLWYDDVSIYGAPCNFHAISEDEHLIVGRRQGADDHIIIWRLKNGNVMN